jgi:hypothetical protein
MLVTTLAGGMLLAPLPAAADTTLVSPPLRSPAGGSLQCVIMNGSIKKPLEEVTIEFRRVNNGTAGATSTCGDGPIPTLSGCSATLAGFCEELACSCIFTFAKGDKRTVRGSLSAIDAAGTPHAAVELHR